MLQQVFNPGEHGLLVCLVKRTVHPSLCCKTSRRVKHEKEDTQLAACTPLAKQIVVATSSPDDMFGDACVVANAVGASNAVSFDLTAACSGFLFALVTASQFVHSGAYR